MPYPSEYQRATDHFAKFLSDVKIISDLGSVHQSYTMAQGVFQVFRRRVSLKDSILFTSALNVGLRALYIADWDTEETMLPFDDYEKMNQEVRNLRPTHNFSTDNAIKEVAIALRLNVDEKVFDSTLEKLPIEPKAFWEVTEKEK